MPTATPPKRTSNAGGVGKKTRYSTNIWLQRVLWKLRPPSTIQLHRTVASWWHSSLVSGVVCCLRETDDEVFMTKSLNVTPKTTEPNINIRSGKSEAAITNNKRLRSRYCTVEANKKKRKHARPVCNSRATYRAEIQGTGSWNEVTVYG